MFKESTSPLTLLVLDEDRGDSRMMKDFGCGGERHCDDDLTTDRKEGGVTAEVGKKRREEGRKEDPKPKRQDDDDDGVTAAATTTEHRCSSLQAPHKDDNFTGEEPQLIKGLVPSPYLNLIPCLVLSHGWNRVSQLFDCTSFDCLISRAEGAEQDKFELYLIQSFLCCPFCPS